LEKQRSQRALDWTSFFLADVETGAGPFMAGYFTAVRHWNPAQIGLVIAMQKIASVAAQIPAGYLIDQTLFKKQWMAAAALVISFGSACTVWAPSLFWQVINQAAVGVSTAIATPLLAALSLGIVGREAFARRVGRNGAFSHAGNMLTAAGAGYLGYRSGQPWIFYLSALLGLACVVSALLIRGGDINHQVAREAPVEHESNHTAPASFASLLGNRIVLSFALMVVLFHAANSALLPLASEELSVSQRKSASLYLLVCIVLPQLIMIPVALVSGRAADQLGRKPVLVGAFCALVLRGTLFALGRNPYYIVGIEMLDGIGTGIAGVVTPLVVADLAQGTGRFNALGGVMQACLGIGAFLGNLLAGMAAKRVGFPPVFFGLAAIALAGLLLLATALPETRTTQHT
jgi:MFS family permease